MQPKRMLLLCLAAVALFLLVPCQVQASELSEIYEKSGAGELYDSLDQGTQDFLSQAGVEDGMWGASEGEDLFQAISQMLREKLTAPLKGVAALLAVVILCRLAGCFEEGSGAALLAGTLACASVLTAPLLELIRAAEEVIDSACVFLGASVPVYSALLVASGNTAVSGSYSFLTLAASGLIAGVSKALLMPLLHAFLMLSLASSLCGMKFDRLLTSLYSFSKWMLVFAVTLFSGILSVQTVENVTYTQAIECPIQEVEDSSLYIGDTRVITRGVEGEEEVNATVTYVNGQETARTVNSTTTLREPTTTVMAVGTKEKPRTASTGSYQWPIYGRITSYFGGRYIFGSYSYHSGIDISASYGAAVCAADGGTVTYAGYRGSYGNLVIITHDNGTQTYYGHNSSLTVSAGDKVYKGQQIARAGSTGRSTGVHCHFEIRINGTSVNPLSYLP